MLTLIYFRFCGRELYPEQARQTAVHGAELVDKVYILRYARPFCTGHLKMPLDLTKETTQTGPSNGRVWMFTARALDSKAPSRSRRFPFQTGKLNLFGGDKTTPILSN